MRASSVSDSIPGSASEPCRIAASSSSLKSGLPSERRCTSAESAGSAPAPRIAPSWTAVSSGENWLQREHQHPRAPVEVRLAYTARLLRGRCSLAPERQHEHDALVAQASHEERHEIAAGGVDPVDVLQDHDRRRICPQPPQHAQEMFEEPDLRSTGRHRPAPAANPPIGLPASHDSSGRASSGTGCELRPGGSQQSGKLVRGCRSDGFPQDRRDWAEWQAPTPTSSRQSPTRHARPGQRAWY